MTVTHSVDSRSKDSSSGASVRLTAANESRTSCGLQALGMVNRRSYLVSSHASTTRWYETPRAAATVRNGSYA